MRGAALTWRGPGSCSVTRRGQDEFSAAPSLVWGSGAQRPTDTALVQVKGEDPKSTREEVEPVKEGRSPLVGKRKEPATIFGLLNENKRYTRVSPGCCGSRAGAPTTLVAPYMAGPGERPPRGTQQQRKHLPPDGLAVILLVRLYFKERVPSTKKAERMEMFITASSEMPEIKMGQPS